MAGFLSIILAITGTFRFLFPIWALIVLVLMFQGFLLKPYTFEGKPRLLQRFVAHRGRPAGISGQFDAVSSPPLTPSLESALPPKFVHRRVLYP